MTVPYEIPYNQRIDYYTKHFLDNIDYSDTCLIYSDILTKSAINYISLYSKQIKTKEDQQKIFTIPVDIILDKSISYPRVFNFLVDYMIEGFEGMGLSDVTYHIADRYTKLNSCEKTTDMTTLEKKVYSVKNLSIGSEAPDLTFQHKGKNISLESFGETPIVLVFWATWCPHCINEIPQIYNTYSSQPVKKFELITVSMDTSYVDWENYLKINKIEKSINYCDTKGWDGKIVYDYSVWGSPTIFVIKNKKIIAKPYNSDNLKDYIRTL